MSTRRDLHTRFTNAGFFVHSERNRRGYTHADGPWAMIGYTCDGELTSAVINGGELTGPNKTEQVLSWLGRFASAKAAA